MNASTIASFLLGSVFSYFASRIYFHHTKKRSPAVDPHDIDDLPTIIDCIGNTPLIYLPTLSTMERCIVLAKCEFLNPGGSTKDRIARAMILQAERHGRLKPPNYLPTRSPTTKNYKNTNDKVDEDYCCGGDGTIYEATSGSTGISLTHLARARGYASKIYLPDDLSVDKYKLLSHLGATIVPCKNVSIVDAEHMTHHAFRDYQKDLTEQKKVVYMDQFENVTNVKCHYETTAPELSDQVDMEKVDAVCMSAGTGGTIAGLARYLKPRYPHVNIILADPQGSGLFHRVNNGCMFSIEEREGRRRRGQMDSIVEGVGLNRMTRNLNVVLGEGASEEDFEDAVELAMNEQGAALRESIQWIDGAERVTDDEVVRMSRFLAHREGLFLGSSSAVNVVAAVKTARRWHKKNPGSERRPVIITFLCDSGSRHLNKLWDADYLRKRGLDVPETVTSLDFIQ